MRFYLPSNSAEKHATYPKKPTELRVRNWCSVSFLPVGDLRYLTLPSLLSLMNDCACQENGLETSKRPTAQFPTLAENVFLIITL